MLGMTTETSDSDGYLDTVSTFIKFLTGNELTLDEILRNLVLVVFASINAEAISLRQLNNDNMAVRTATWGMSPEMILKPGDVYDFKDKYPSNDTLRFRRVTLINTLPDWGDEYPLLKDFPYTTGAKSCICFPIDKSGTPVASLCIFSRDVLYPSTELAVFLSAIGNVFSMYMFNQDSKQIEVLKDKSEHVNARMKNSGTELTDRQMVILRLIGGDRTNRVISELLGYSESTIRQETMQIFVKLNCSDRYEAANIYRERYGKEQMP